MVIQCHTLKESKTEEANNQPSHSVYKIENKWHYSCYSLILIFVSLPLKEEDVGIGCFYIKSNKYSG